MKKFFIILFSIILIIVSIYTIIPYVVEKIFFYERIVISNGSMSPEYNENQKIRAYKYLDVFVVDETVIVVEGESGEQIIGKIVAKSEDEILFDETGLYVNNKLVKGGYTNKEEKISYKIDDGGYYILNNQVDSNLDSRNLGTIYISGENKNHDFIGALNFSPKHEKQICVGSSLIPNPFGNCKSGGL